MSAARVRPKRRLSRRPPTKMVFAAWSELRHVFGVAMRHFRLPRTQRRAAWESAKADSAQAYRCYGAIARSVR